MKTGLVLLLCVLSLHFAVAPSVADILTPESERTATTDRLQQITNDLKGRLEIIETVLVSVVDHNPLVMSVETLTGRSGPFVMTVDEKFIRSLSVPELEAALAHELGHVWIYTHAPYVQSERLANDVAMRVTSRTVLEPVYEKVWQRIGLRGKLSDVINTDGPNYQQQH
jgi:uncharacterized membrane protein